MQSAVFKNLSSRAYWHLNREKGATCDFGGTGHLLHVKPNHLLASAAKWSFATIMDVVSLALVAVGAAIVSVVRWRQLRVRRQYSPIGGHL
ncbi:unnamed protein product [Peronospora farinosa]|uniref:X8 domain-containing protein n=1 Tax=Peronospora farinosa TaxID=134698 RepID=A0AAV0TQ57_9STRA|nr:unnamed protein product [Peronospora farinosa]